MLGRNGVGKTTLLLTIMGYTDVSRGTITWRGREITRVAAASAGARRARLGGAGAGDLRLAERRGEPDGRGAAGPLGPRPGLRALPAPRGAPRQPGPPPVRRRAADAGDRARPDDQPGAPAAGRAARGAGADRRRGAGGGDPAHAGGRWRRRHPRRAARRDRAVAHRVQRGPGARPRRPPGALAGAARGPGDARPPGRACASRGAARTEPRRRGAPARASRPPRARADCGGRSGSPAGAPPARRRAGSGAGSRSTGASCRRGRRAGRGRDPTARSA